MTESVEWERLADHEEVEQPIKPVRCRCYMPTTAMPPPVITAADQVRRNLRMSAKWARFGRLMVEQLLSEHDAAVERAEKAETARDTAVAAWSAQQDIIEAERRRADAAEQELAVLPERWRELMAERDAARRELAEVRDEYANLEAESSRIADRAGAYRREVEELRRFVGEPTAGTAAEALRDSPVGQFERLVAERTERFREAWQSAFDLALKMRDDSVTVKLSDGEIRVPTDCPIPDDTLRAMNAMGEKRKAADDV